ncbi:pre-mRNA splicing factor component-domain-containing protein [Cantharellus anzutake]|uniref:pre-mRNA splicing factor component-domain-containing protein n=1 Tax=Cantharellus anzutake TaxID=1750568 RepID=UPI001903C9C2|nr:pre-mRNA splicing factor component-domain-containing protein [Cantharellus anzutake]KAF8334255.1 pre-mRNA splicing factor component-domain-containing protein [Cantharellus anzutake]
MVRILVKGGVWKNTEDEVLKAAIAKYGKNQWARISSLLVRKTPKQCKARWYEWLDPSIKKTEWSKTEDEKLLHLAKLMPTQWRTIAPIVGRTATQCLERYQKLLDDAEAKENEELGLGGPGAEAGPSADDIRKLRPGEIDPDPETKPARPDPIDMDEDEKEMLSEARARLANTQGKKAKRKARERQLEEARRLAVLQKKRELKAAGIIMRYKTKKRGMDYNTDIPFEKKPAPGFYDVSEEDARAQTAPIGQSLRRLENKRKPEEEAAEAKKRARKNAPKDGEHQTKFVAARDAQIQRLKEAEQISKRRKLELPAAQVGETELEEIVKIGQAGENARALLSSESEAAQASGRLLGDYEGFDRAKMARTPRTAPQADTVMVEARNLRNMVTAQTPLLGHENTPLHTPIDGGTGFEGATPRHSVAFTPNPLATPLRQRGGPYDPSQTPQSETGTTVGATPMRDRLSINTEDGPDGFIDAKRTLRLGFASLPKPLNDFEIEMPEDEGLEAGGEGQVLTEEDAAERDAKMKRQQEEEARMALARRSLVVQQSLPRPANVDVTDLLDRVTAANEERDPVQQMIDVEFVNLMEHDSIAHPIPGTAHPGGTQSSYAHPEDDAMTVARSAIHTELAKTLGFPDANAEQIKQGINLIVKEEDVDLDAYGWAKIRSRLSYDAQRRVWIEPNELTTEARVAGLAVLLEEERDEMTTNATKASKLEKKLGKLLGGYRARSDVLSKRVSEAFAELQKVSVDFESFSRLNMNEQAVGPRRVETLKEEVAQLEIRGRMLQLRFKELDEEKREIGTRVEAKQEALMMSLEEVNEVALSAA